MLEKNEEAGGLPAGVVDAAVVEIGKKPPAVGAGAGAAGLPAA